MCAALALFMPLTIDHLGDNLVNSLEGFRVRFDMTLVGGRGSFATRQKRDVEYIGGACPRVNVGIREQAIG